MVTKEDYKNLLEYFETHAIPEELEEFIEKLKILYDILLLQEKYQIESGELNDKLRKYVEKDK